MADHTQSDLLGLGQHCAHPECKQLDFLPFQCDCCRRTFCLDHRSYSAHSCASAQGKSCEVIVCPICAKGVKLNGRDPNVAFDEHQRQGCDPSNYAKVHKKPKCPVRGCKEKLSTINTYQCQACHQRVCLRHRDKEDHACAEVRAAAAAQRGAVGTMFDRMRQAVMPTPAPTTAGTLAAAQPSQPPRRPMNHQQVRAAALQQYADPANSVRGTAARRMPDAAPQQPTQTVLNPVHGATTHPASNANPLVPPHLPEQCPQCGARFASVDRLVQHVEDFHPTHTHQQPARAAASAAWGVPQGASGASDAYRCPHCAREFADAVLLVGHVDGCVAGRQRPVSATGAGTSSAGKGECTIC